MQTNQKPWLDSQGRELKDNELEVVSKSWDVKTWNSYLATLEVPRQESLVPNYDRKVRKMTKSCFATGFRSTEADINLCESILRSLPELESRILHLTFLEGLTERTIGKMENISQSNVNKIKRRAIQMIQDHFEAGGITRRIMKGELLELAKCMELKSA